MLQIHWSSTRCVRACGFDVFDGPAFLPSGSVHWMPDELFASPPPRTIIFERRDVRARYESWRRAMQTDNWSSGQMQHVNCSNSSDVRAHPSVSCVRSASGISKKKGRQCVYDGSCLENFSVFKAKNDAWFARVRALAVDRSSAWLQVYSEDWFDRQDVTGKRIMAFLLQPTAAGPHRRLRDIRLNLSTSAEANLRWSGGDMSRAVPLAASARALGSD